MSSLEHALNKLRFDFKVAVVMHYAQRSEAWYKRMVAHQDMLERTVYATKAQCPEIAFHPVAVYSLYNVQVHIFRLGDIHHRKLLVRYLQQVVSLDSKGLIALDLFSIAAFEHPGGHLSLTAPGTLLCASKDYEYHKLNDHFPRPLICIEQEDALAAKRLAYTKQLKSAPAPSTSSAKQKQPSGQGGPPGELKRGTPDSPNPEPADAKRRKADARSSKSSPTSTAAISADSTAKPPVVKIPVVPKAATKPIPAKAPTPTGPRALSAMFTPIAKAPIASSPTVKAPSPVEAPTGKAPIAANPTVTMPPPPVAPPPAVGPASDLIQVLMVDDTPYMLAFLARHKLPVPTPLNNRTLLAVVAADYEDEKRGRLEDRQRAAAELQAERQAKDTAVASAQAEAKQSRNELATEREGRRQDKETIAWYDKYTEPLRVGPPGFSG
ncbi:unnamed protein product [Peniophora sp. CBMAI 1063]|nr:unnamed protein product [Peniophora sp. CBMAI 1063]